jgi:RHS repeat-associated protein
VRRATAAITLLLAGLTPAYAQQAPGLQKGFVADKAYSTGDVDAINTFNGNLLVQVPVGPTFPVNGGLSYSLGLSYNSKVWDYVQAGQYIRAVPNRRSNAGLGWLVSFGRVFSPMSPGNSSNSYVYESADGADHVFAGMPPGPGGATPMEPPVVGVAYTDDGSHLRMLFKDVDDNGNIDTWEVESSDGIVRSFTAPSGRLTTIRDHSSNFVSVTLTTSATNTPCTATANFSAAWLITNSDGSRANYVCFAHQTYPDSMADGRVERIVLAAPPDPVTGVDRSATYVFAYVDLAVSRGCHSTYPNDVALIQLPLLNKITLPDGSAHYFSNFTDGGCRSGALASYTRPTGAATTYTYRTYKIETDRCDQKAWNSQLLGVATRAVTGPKLPTATWTYSSVLSSQPDFVKCDGLAAQVVLRNAPSEEMTVTVLDPLGNVTENAYSVWPVPPGEGVFDANGQPRLDPSGTPYTQTSSNQFVATEYGLPLTHLSTSGGKFLKNRVFTAAGYAADPKQPLRSVYATWIHGNGFCASSLDECLPVNSLQASQRIVYHDDGDSVATTENSDPDGFGHFRRVTLSGTLPGSVREIYTAFNTRQPNVNPDTGIVSSAIPSTSKTWFLDSAPSIEVSEAESLVTQVCRDETTGAVLATRVLKGASPGDSDLVTVFGFDAANNVTSESFYGGDIKKNAPVGTTLCAFANDPPATYDYKFLHTYQGGIRKSSQYEGSSFFTLDLQIHSKSGLPVSSKDTAGGITSLSYDLSGRLLKVAPPGVSATSYAYSNASPPGASYAPAKVLVTTPSATNFGTIETEYQYDGIGRLWRTNRRMPDESTSVSETTRNAMGWLATAAAPQLLTVNAGAEYDVVLGALTTYGGYDPFGRAGTVTAPDGSVTSAAYKGVRLVDRTRRVATLTAPDEPITTREIYDRLGRLSSVTEALGSVAEAVTEYSYDEGDRLAEVSAGTQKRTFRYDHRGLLELTKQPELGSTGNGSVAYGTTSPTGAFTGTYDARGHAHRSITGSVGGPFDVSFVFDNAERITDVSETSTGRPLKQFAYDDPAGTRYAACSGGRCKGRLAAAGRWNYSPSLGTVAVSESYAYDGLGGRVSRRDRSIGAGTGFANADFFFLQTYTDQGLVSTITYPCRSVGGTCAGTEPARTVTYEYKRGLLSKASPWLTDATYQSNGAIDTLTHGPAASGIREKWLPDPSGIARPAQIFAVSAAGATLWTTAPYLYDGSGNIRQIGSGTYKYDAFGRLARWATESTAVTTSFVYDRFGNMLNTSVSFCGTNPNGSSRCGGSTSVVAEVVGTTNHYAGPIYNDAGAVTADGAHTYAYDALGMASETVVAGRRFSYLYSADDERVAAVESSGGTNRTTWTLRGFESQLLRVWTDQNSLGTAVTWQEDEIWRGALLLAAESSAGTRHYVLDHLGSPRFTSDSTGNHVQNFAPFGAGGSAGSGALQFTGHERDAATLAGGTLDLPDYMRARFYSIWTSRFLSPDPLLGESNNPQSWNRYAYALNNPMKYTDPTGEMETAYRCDQNGDHCYYETTQPALPYTALDTAATFIDGSFATAFKISGAGNVMAGIYNDSPIQIAKGVGQELMLAGPSAVGAGLQPLSAVGSLSRVAVASGEARAVLVIGKLADTEVLANTAGHEVINLADWTLAQNDALIMQGVQEGRTFYMASNATAENLTHPVFGLSVYGRELGMLMNSGYTRVGFYLVAP